MESAINLRATPRLRRRMEDFWQLNINHDELITRNIVNLSPQGVSFKTPQRVAFGLGQTIRVMIRLGSERIFECEGKVVWIKDLSYGVHFFKLPMSYDSWVMREIHQSELLIHRDKFSLDTKNRVQNLREENREKQKNRMLSSTFDLVLICFLTTAFIIVALIHEQGSKNSSFAKILEREFIQRMTISK